MGLDLIFIAVGLLFLAGLGADLLGRFTKVPRVTLLILLGVLVGPKGLAVLPEEFSQLYSFLTAIALTMVAFLLGNSFSPAVFAREGRAILAVSLSIVFATVFVVGGVLWAFGVPVVMALILAGIATATDPVATRDVIRQFGHRNRFSDLLTGTVAIDDAWGIIAFSLLLILATGLGTDGAFAVLSHGLWEIFGALAIGFGVGLPSAYLTGRIRPGEPALVEALGIVFLCAGLALWLEVSYLLAGMTAGAVIVNFARHHERPFHEIEMVEWPFMLLFFVLAGAALDIGHLTKLGLIGGGFVVLRCLARLLGGWVGGGIAGLGSAERLWIGPALLPQAGVAVGMALAAGRQFPELQETILAVTLSTTVIFEIAGPFATQHALTRVRQSEGRN